jgi:hypothetical protein
MKEDQLQRLRDAANQWDIRIQSIEPGYEWYKVSFGLKNAEDGEAIVAILQQALGLSTEKGRTEQPQLQS